MLDVYKTSLKNILYLCKFVGIIKMSYILESDGLLIQSTNTIYKCLEFTQIIILLIFSHSVSQTTFFIHKIFLFKLWSVIITSRLSETHLIQ